MDTTVHISNNVYRMIDILRKNKEKPVKARQLLKILGLKNTRSIHEYKKKIEYLGYHIESFGGYHGGYSLVEEYLTNDEIKFVKSILPEKLAKKIIKINERI